ncbi:uncharacterized protein FTOL_12680 [Fusarium torulosum]|uniref:Uncharacterized protein n=1 Tax=Fusarium torulosum TaxID=33205 RepID=A0AAE8MM54_9HYPO|nr:uncharacterized protein FTOL_12680 [Fusarium torulosum]
MANQEQHAANRAPNRGQRPQMNDQSRFVPSAEQYRNQGDVADGDSHPAPIHPHNALGIQPGLPSNAGNENQGIPNYPPGPNQHNHPWPAPNPNPVQIVTSREFLTTPFPPLEHRLFTIEKRISSAEWVSANTGMLQEMTRRHLHDVPFRVEIRDRISPDLWPIIPLETRVQVLEWLTPSQKVALTRMLPCDFQTEMTIVEEHTLPLHPDEVYLRTIEEAIPNLPQVYFEGAVRIKLEINNMLSHHQDWMQENRAAQHWLLQRKDQITQHTIALWINSWSGRRNGMRPPINRDGRVVA